MDRIPYILLPLLGGALIAAQAPINARLRVVVGSPVASAALSFVVGTVVLVVGALVVGAVVVVVVAAAARWSWATMHPLQRQCKRPSPPLSQSV